MYMNAIKGLDRGFVSVKNADHFKLFIIFIVLAAIIIGINMMPQNRTYHDETFHLPQIHAYYDGKYFYIDKFVTVIPGYHALVAGLSKIFFSRDIDAYRIVSFFLSAFSLLFFYLIAKRLNHESPLGSTAVFLLCPLFYPFFFVIYTDMTAMSFVLAGVYFSLSGRYLLAGAILLFSLLIRQTNVIWLGFCWGMIFYQEFGGIKPFLQNFNSQTKNRLLKLSLRTAPFPIGIIAFLTFVYLNNGVAVGDSGSHQLGRVYFTQAFLWLFVVFLVMLPLHLVQLPKIYRLIKQSPEWLLFISVGFALYFLTFWTDHSYNTLDFFIRNKFVLWLKASDFNKIIVALPMALAFLTLAVTPLREKRFYWLYPIMLVSVLPHALVEQRYFMDTIALLMLFLHVDNRKLQIATIALYIPVSIYLYSGISKIQFFL